MVEIMKLEDEDEWWIKRCCIVKTERTTKEGTIVVIEVYSNRKV